MMWRSHLVMGVVAAEITFEVLEITRAPELYALALLGSLVPDLDEPRAKLSRILFFISIPLSKVVTHRGFTHTLLFSALVASGLYLLSVPLAMVLFLSVGILSHLIADAMTYVGVPWLYPLSRGRLSLGLFTTDSWQEKLFIGLVILGLLGFYYTLLAPEFVSL